MVSMYLSENKISQAFLTRFNFCLVQRRSVKVLLVVSIISFAWLFICLISINSYLTPNINQYYIDCLVSDQSQIMETTEEIVIASQYKGAIWAGKILKDWQFNVRYGKPTAQTRLMILNEDQEEQYRQFDVDKIVMRGIEMGSHHVLALSGVLVTFGQQKQFFFPRFIVESCVSNSLAIISLQFLYDKKKQPSTNSHIAHHISLVSLVKYFGAFNISAKQFGMISRPRGENVLEGGAPFYSVYKCKEGYLAVGNLQAKFYMEMIKGLDLSEEERQFCEEGQHTDEVAKLRDILTRKFMEKTAEQWEKHYLNFDTCITAIRSPFRSNIREPKVIDLQPKL